MATLAIGTDTDGSVRVPAGFNGLVCLKTTRCRISLQGVTPLRPTLDTIGSIERTVSNAALMYRRMQVPDPPSTRTHALVRLRATLAAASATASNRFRPILCIGMKV